MLDKNEASYRARGMRLNLGRIERAAKSQPGDTLNDACQDSSLPSFKRSNSGHRGYPSLARTTLESTTH